MDPKKLYLAQTDTTVGFLSQDAKRLAAAKGRPAHKAFIIAVSSAKNLKNFVRVPKKWRKLVRQARRTTFAYPNGKAVRVVKNSEHRRFLDNFGWMYSTSANPSGKNFDEAWARQQADVVVEDKRGFFEGKPSKILRLGRTRVMRLR